MKEILIRDLRALLSTASGFGQLTEEETQQKQKKKEKE